MRLLEESVLYAGVAQLVEQLICQKATLYRNIYIENGIETRKPKLDIIWQSRAKSLTR